MTSNPIEPRIATDEHGDALRVPTLLELATLSYQLSEYVYWRQVVELGQALYGPNATVFELDTIDGFDQEGNPVAEPVGLLAYDKDGKRIRHFDFETPWWTSAIPREAFNVMDPDERLVFSKILEQQDEPVTPLQFIDGIIASAPPRRRGIVPPYMQHNIERQRVAHKWLERDNFYCGLLDIREHRGFFRAERLPSHIDAPPTVYIPATWKC